MKLLLFCISLFASHFIYGQEIYMPRDVKKAYVKQTRSMDGMPGKNYWQNHAKYLIELTATPPERTIAGTETITYFNNSPDTLKTPTLKLFLNIHKPTAPRDYEIDSSFITNGIIVDSIYCNNVAFDLNNKRLTATNFPLKLPKPLAPKDSMTFTFKWHYQIAAQASKEGMIDSTTYFFGLFYPRIAVYDDYNGWDRSAYAGIREFYSDYNDYDVTINVPPTYLVWGTGQLQQPENLLQPGVLEKYKLAKQSGEVIHVVTQEDLTARMVTANNLLNRWRFITKNIPDVVYGISNHYIWDAATSRNGTLINVAYNDAIEEYHHTAKFSQSIIKWYADNFPGIAYPYPYLNVFQASEEMEYPMLVNMAVYEDTAISKFILEHEIAHNYFPFFVGTNETKYGFMDEGWATAFELLIGIADKGKEEAEDFYKKIRVSNWTNNETSGVDLPIICPSNNLVSAALIENEYSKPSLGFLALKDLLSDSLFKKSLHFYINQWKGKHPIPWDMFNCFNTASGQNLNWFWNNWFFSNYYIDLKLEKAKQIKNSCEIVIQNIGGIAASFDIVVSFQDGTTELYHQAPQIWKANLKTVTIKLPAMKKIKSVKIDGGIFLDTNTLDNEITL